MFFPTDSDIYAEIPEYTPVPSKNQIGLPPNSRLIVSRLEEAWSTTILLVA